LYWIIVLPEYNSSNLSACCVNAVAARLSFRLISSVFMLIFEVAIILFSQKMLMEHNKCQTTLSLMSNN
jgi:hypothetical protein